jgi:ATP-dependent DNA helicase PIF1
LKLSFAGVGFGNDTLGSYVKKINFNSHKKKDWIKTKVLIIDEISMINGQLLDLVEALARVIRRSERPFGGIQVVFSGDFYQLPPVKSDKLAFEAKCWKMVIQEYKMLTTPFRQKDMRKFGKDIDLASVTYHEYYRICKHAE